MSENTTPSVPEEEVSVPESETAPEVTPVVEADPVVETTPIPEPPKKIKKIKKPRPLALRIPLYFLSMLLCIAIFMGTVGGALLLDLRVMTSREGLTKIVSQLINPSVSVPDKDSLFAIESVSPVRLAEEALSDYETSGILTDVVYDMLHQYFGDEEIPIEKEKVTEFIEESNMTEFFTDKLVGVADDFFNDTSATVITKEEVVQLVQDNTELIEEKLEITITEEHIEKFETALEEVKPLEKIEDQGLLNYLVDLYAGADSGEAEGEAGGEPGGETGGVATPDDGKHETSDHGNELLDRLALIKKIVEYIRIATSYTTLSYLGGLLLVLMLLVWLANGTLPKTLCDLGITLTLAGLILSALNITADSGLMATLLPIPTNVLGVIYGVLSAVAPVHYGVLIAGVVLILLAITAKIIKTSIQRKARLAEA